MRKSATDLESGARHLENETVNLERQARESDATEQRARQTIDRVKNNT